MKPSRRIKEIFHEKLFDLYGMQLIDARDAELDPKYQHMMNEAIFQYLDEQEPGEYDEEE